MPFPCNGCVVYVTGDNQLTGWPIDFAAAVKYNLCRIDGTGMPHCKRILVVVTKDKSCLPRQRSVCVNVQLQYMPTFPTDIPCVVAYCFASVTSFRISDSKWRHRTPFWKSTFKR